MNPGVPIMKSKDLINWEIVNYVYDVLEHDDKQELRNGKNEYGKGSWASSIKYDGKFKGRMDLSVVVEQLQMLII